MRVAAPSARAGPMPSACTLPLQGLQQPLLPSRSLCWPLLLAPCGRGAPAARCATAPIGCPWLHHRTAAAAAPAVRSVLHKHFINGEVCCNPDPVVFGESSNVRALRVACARCLLLRLPRACPPCEPRHGAGGSVPLKQATCWCATVQQRSNGLPLRLAPACVRVQGCSSSAVDASPEFGSASPL